MLALPSRNGYGHYLVTKDNSGYKDKCLFQNKHQATRYIDYLELFNLLMYCTTAHTIFYLLYTCKWSCCDRMVVEFTTTYAIIAYHH